MILNKINVFDLKGSIIKNYELPISLKEFKFNEPRVVNYLKVVFYNNHQVQGRKIGAGIKTAAIPSGTGKNMSRQPRILVSGNFKRVVNVPNAIGGRQAHPLKVEKIIRKKMNHKEKRYCRQGLLYSIFVEKYLKNRPYYENSKNISPIIISDESYNLIKNCKDFTNFLKVIGYSAPDRKNSIILFNNRKLIKKNLSNLSVLKIINYKKLQDLQELGSGTLLGKYVIFSESTIDYILKNNF